MNGSELFPDPLALARVAFHQGVAVGFCVGFLVALVGCSFLAEAYFRWRRRMFGS